METRHPAEVELEDLKRRIQEALKVPPPPDPQNLPSGPPEIVHVYKVGYANGWVFGRQFMKKLLFPNGN